MRGMRHLSTRLGFTRITAVVVFVSLTTSGRSAVAQQAPAAAQPAASRTQDLGVRIDAPPAVLKYHNRPITMFPATVPARPPVERPAATAIVRRLDLLLEHATSGMSVTTRSMNGATAIVVDGRDVFAIVPEDVDTLAGEPEPQRAAGGATASHQAIR